MSKLHLRQVHTYLLIIGLVLSGHLSANPDNLVVYRQKIMGSVGAHMKALAIIAKEGKDSSLVKHMSHHGHALKELASMSKEIFSHASKGSKKSKAKAEIWSGNKLSEKFVKELEKFEKSAQEVASLTAKNDFNNLKKSLKTIGASCKSCHTSFKVKD